MGFFIYLSNYLFIYFFICLFIYLFTFLFTFYLLFIYFSSPCHCSQVPHSNFPCGPDGSGYYSDNTLCCFKVIYEAAPLVLDAIKSASVKPGSVFTIADYGCADGGTSMPLLCACVQELRKIHGDDLSINVIYEDQPVNDFKSLFLRLQGKVVELKEL